jgi:TatD DNase family protein
MKPVDSHSHLDFDRFDSDREEIIEKCRERLEFVVNAGSNMDHNRKALELEEKTCGFVRANLGLHPTYTDSFDEIDEIKQQIRERDSVAIGEIGLDHHHVTEETEREKQEEVFREMLQLAEELEKPVVLHTREAEELALQILEEFKLEGVMLHCFNGRPELAEEAVKRGYLIGVTTQVLYSTRVQNIVEEIQVEDILLETDSPFLYHGERNEPVNVHESAEKIADIKGLKKKEVVETTTGNAEEFFSD